MKKDLPAPKSNIFQYFDDNFYDFITTTSRGKSNKKIRFKNKNSKIFTPQDAFLLKVYIDKNNLRYNRLNIKQLLDHPQRIQNILNLFRNNKTYK